MPTRRVALIGRPLRRRHSAVMHNAAFAAFQIDAHYELCELEADALPAFVSATRGPEWLGFQVTAPYKRRIVDLVDEVDEAARAIGAVNSVVRESDGRLVGFNTDAPGFAAAVTDELGVALRAARVVIAGAGGAAYAVGDACARAGAALVTVGNRTAAAAEQLAGDLGAAVVGVGLADPAFRRALGAATLFVNATTVGMTEPGPVVPVAELAPTAAVFDLVYVPTETALLAEARVRGLSAVNGSGMLVRQAAIAFRRWTGTVDASPVMTAAVSPLLAGTAGDGHDDAPVASSERPLGQAHWHGRSATP